MNEIEYVDHGMRIAHAPVMRSFSLIMVLATACTSSSSGSYTVPPPSTPDRIVTMHCSTSIADYCATYSCNQTLDAAEHDTRLCGPGFRPGLSACGDYEVVSKSYIDTGIALYYQNGELVAAVGTGLLGHCTAGPETFDAPQCTSGDFAPLAACSASP